MKNEENYFRMVEYETHIEEIIQHNQNLYRYRGQPGQEYGVIQSIFQELNRRSDLSNRHIRWYTSIISLALHYRRRQDHYQLIDTLEAKPADLSPCHQIGFPNEFPDATLFPEIIDAIETYMIQIARLGILISSKIDIYQQYLHLRLNHIGELLIRLLADMKSRDLSSPDLDIYILSIRNATENSKKISISSSGSIRNEITRAADSQVYREVITRRTEKIPVERLKSLYNVDDFWNGLIP